MSDYTNCRIQIGNTAIDNSLIARGSYSFIKDKRVSGSWEDGNGISHDNIFDKRKVTITFSLRERSLEEQESLAGIFATQENVLVTYFDDYDCTFKQGNFKMNAPTINHLNVSYENIEYAATQIILEEY